MAFIADGDAINVTLMVPKQMIYLSRVAGLMIIATVERRCGDISKDKAPNRKRSLVWRFGAFFLARLNTMSCCLSKRFSAIVALVPPNLSDFANSTKRSMKRKATDFMSGMLSRHLATTRLHIDLLFCGDYQFAMHKPAVKASRYCTDDS